MIYTQHDLSRIAGEHIVKDFQKDSTLEFTNTSYGCKGKVLGSLYSKTKCKETTILYYIEGAWWSDDKEIKLVRSEEVSSWTPSYHKETHTVTLMTLYYVTQSNESVFTDDKDWADKSHKIHAERRSNYDRPASNYITKAYKLKITSSLYDRIYNYLIDTRGEKIKYGAEISLKHAIDLRQNKVELYVNYIYRNKPYSVRKSSINY